MAQQYDDYPMPAFWDSPLFGPRQAAADPFAQSANLPTAQEKVIAGLVWQHQGRENPVSIAKLCEATGYSERTVKGIVEQLIVMHHIRIGGRRDDKPGYFVVVDRADQQLASLPIRNQIVAMARRLAVIESPEAVRELLGQQRLEVG